MATFKVSLGEYAWKEEEMWNARDFFVYVIGEVEKKDDRLRVLHDLRDDVLPFVPKSFSGMVNPIDPVDRALEGWINEWLKRWNLPEWMSEQAEMTLWFWVQNPKYANDEPLEWGIMGVSPATFCFPSEPLTIDQQYNWDVHFETKEAARERILADLARRVDEYLDRTAEAATNAGLMKTKDLRQPLHFEWLVRYQVQGWSQDRIALEYDVGKDTVNKALHDKAKALGIELRRNPNIKTYR